MVGHRIRSGRHPRRLPAGHARGNLAALGELPHAHERLNHPYPLIPREALGALRQAESTKQTRPAIRIRRRIRRRLSAVSDQQQPNNEMNTPTPTPTPRTDAAWASSFEPCEYRAAHTARTMRECSQQLETELAALTAERDQLRVDLELADVMYQRECEVEHELRTEVERLRADRTYNHECINRLASATGTLGEKSEKVVDVVLSTIAQLHALQIVCGTTDADKFSTWVDRAYDRALRAEAEVERLRSDRGCEKRLRKDADEFRENAIARAERAEDNLAALEQSFDDNCRGVVRIADELATAKERLRSEAMDDYAAIKDLQRELATVREIVRVLKLDKDRLDWWNGESYYQFGKSHKCMNPGWWWSCGFDQIQGKSGIKNIRDAIDSAMAHSKSGRNKYNVCKRIEKSETEDAK